MKLDKHNAGQYRHTAQEVVIKGSMFLIVLTLLQSCGCKTTLNHLRAQELCES